MNEWRIEYQGPASFRRLDLAARTPLRLDLCQHRGARHLESPVELLQVRCEEPWYENSVIRHPIRLVVETPPQTEDLPEE